MKKTIITIIICAVVFTTIGVMAGSYNAKQISYTPSDSTWNVSNVSSAIDNIKQTDKIQIANLQSAVSNKQATIDEMLLTYKRLDAKTTATADDIVSGKTAYDSNGTLITGTNTQVEELENRTIKTFEYKNITYSANETITKNYTATEKSIVVVTLISTGHPTNPYKTLAQLAPSCSISSNGTQVYNNVLTHGDGGDSYHVVATYRLEKNQYINVSVTSGSGGAFFYAAYDMVVNYIK